MDGVRSQGKIAGEAGIEDCLQDLKMALHICNFYIDCCLPVTAYLALNHPGLVRGTRQDGCMQHGVPRELRTSP